MAAVVAVVAVMAMRAIVIEEVIMMNSDNSIC